MRLEAAAAQTIFAPTDDKARKAHAENARAQTSGELSRGMEGSSARSGDAAGSSGSEPELNQEEKKRVAELERRDMEVRNHERAHLGAAGSLARGGASFEYETGPDGRRYAVGGEVSIDTSEVRGDPAATVRKMRQVQRAALAPGDPSPQDRQVAAQAAQQAARAQHESNEKGSLVDLTA